MRGGGLTSFIMRATSSSIIPQGNRNLKLESKLPPVQSAVNGLVKTGDALSSGTVDGSYVNSAVVAGLESAAKQISTTQEAKDAVPPMIDAFNALSSALASGNKASAEKTFVTAVQTLRAWATDAGVENYLKYL